MSSILTLSKSVSRSRFQARLISLAKIAGLTLLFSLAYAQSPLYTSNQNQYFLHGLAQAGVGSLDQDWLANTQDPTPVFSALVWLVYRLLPWQPVFYLIYTGLMGVYLFSVLSIVDTVWHIRRSQTALLVFVAGFFLLHSAGLRYALSRLIGAEQGYLFEEGMAGQRLLGPVLQPSSFAVFLLLSLALFLKHRQAAAIISAVLAALFHPTYLLSAGVLVATYLLVILWEGWPRRQGEWRLVQDTHRRWHIQASGTHPPEQAQTMPWPLMARVLGLGLLALGVVAPMLVYVYSLFAGTPPETTALARQILVHTRIPHHALISWWFDFWAVLKLGLIAAALYAIRRTRLFVLLLIPVLASLCLSVLQAITNNDALALIFPWRLSVWLYPLHVALLLGWVASRLAERFLPGSTGATWIRRASLAVISLTVLVGATRFTLDLQRKASTPENAMVSYLQANPQAGAVYLIPVKLQDFRLATGAPIFVEFKTIPYRDEDVLEWTRRYELADAFYHNPDCAGLALFAQEGVTHVVLPAAEASLGCPGLEPIYEDGSFSVFRLTFSQ